MPKLVRLKIFVTGTVQGVGMRPTIYRQALESNITGYVNNTPQGVLIEAQGTKEQIKAFLDLLKNAPPPQAIIDHISSQEIEVSSDEKCFVIIESSHTGDKNTEISPDLATCPDCLRDIFDKNNRRYHYPFTNCTNCGPRLSIIKDRPYDRPLTSMHSFPMCSDCLKEYHDPLDRRFHAQPNACPVCGPQLSIHNHPSINPIKDTVSFIKQEKIVAIKGLGGFNLACLPYGMAIQKLRTLKKRPTKSFALMAKNIFLINEICHISNEEERELKSPRAPIVLLKKKNSCTLLEEISPDNNYLGFMLPYTPLHHLLMEHFDFLIMTSANEKDEPIAINNIEILKLYEKNFCDYILNHNREIVHRLDDSIVQFIGNQKQIIRRSRGYVPRAIPAISSHDNLLCLGANMKNTFSLSREKKVYLSQHIGELIDYRNHEFQQSEIRDFQNLLNIAPEKIRCDAHPGYENFSKNYQPIYHHFAHYLSVLGEHRLDPKECLGIICDGTGYGEDGAIWGFEFLSTDNLSTQKRLAHLDYFELPGSEIAITEIDRIEYSLLHQSLIDLPSPFTGNASQRKRDIFMLINKKLNSPLTSSLGRLFDGVSSILNLTKRSEYEAQGAIMLQKAAESNTTTNLQAYPVSIIHDSILRIDYREMIRALVHDIKEGLPTTQCAYKFHLWVVESIIEVALALAPNKKICLSGGCFQNKLLMELLTKRLNEIPMPWHTNEIIPVNDAGISYGQRIWED